MVRSDPSTQEAEVECCEFEGRGSDVQVRPYLWGGLGLAGMQRLGRACAQLLLPAAVPARGRVVGDVPRTPKACRRELIACWVLPGGGDISAGAQRVRSGQKPCA